MKVAQKNKHALLRLTISLYIHLAEHIQKLLCDQEASSLEVDTAKTPKNFQLSISVIHQLSAKYIS